MAENEDKARIKMMKFAEKENVYIQNYGRTVSRSKKLAKNLIKNSIEV